MPRVLVVDDIAGDRNELAVLLRREHYDVGQASSPEEALGQFETFRPDVAVIDYRCRNGEPSDDGGVYVATHADPMVPKIMISAVADRRELKKAIGIAVGYLDKQEIRGSEGVVLVRAVREAVELRLKWLREAQASVPAELARQHLSVRRLMMFHSGSVVVTGLLLALVLVYHLMHQEGSGANAIIVVGAAISADLILLLILRRSEPVIDMARQHDADLAIRAKYEVLLRSCDRLESEKERDNLRMTLIVDAARAWLSPETQPQARAEKLHRGSSHKKE